MREIRVSIAVIVCLLICFGVVMIYSASGIYALQAQGRTVYYLNRHLVFLAVGFFLTGLIMAYDYRRYRTYSKLFVGIAFALLILVLIPGIGSVTFGAQRWFRWGMMSFQPSEYAKLALLIYAADFLARKQSKIKQFREGCLPLLLISGSMSLLILLQPDLGNALFILILTSILMILAGTRWLYFGILSLLALPAFYFVVVRVPYRWLRIVSFLDPWQDPQGKGFQLIQSQIALGSGGFWGVGLGQSKQKLFYLPAAHTDFIFSIIGEELGFLGTCSIILLFMLLIWQGARVAKRTSDPFGYFLAVGIVAMLGLQAVLNIGVSIGALPTKGLPLPFISYGGSSLVFNMMAVGLLLNIARIHDLNR